MAEHVAEVVRATAQTVWLQASRRSACNSCVQQQGCGVSSLGKLFGKRNITFTVENTLNLKPQDQVVVRYEPNALLSLSAKAYVLPVLLFFLFAMGGTFLNQWLSVGSEWPVVASAALGVWVAGVLLQRTRAPKVTIARQLVHHAPVVTLK